MQEKGAFCVVRQPLFNIFKVSVLLIFSGFPFSGSYVILFLSDAERVQQDSSACCFIINFRLGYSGQISCMHKERLR